jgi:hypothetical protein
LVRRAAAELEVDRVFAAPARARRRREGTGALPRRRLDADDPYAGAFHARRHRLPETRGDGEHALGEPRGRPEAFGVGVYTAPRKAETSS